MTLVAAALSLLADQPVPAGDPSRWVSDSDYPAALVQADVEGTAGVELQVDAGGAVASCAISATSGSAELDALTCELLRQRARFTPQTSSAEPMAIYRTRVTWRIPRTKLITQGGRVTFAVGPQGELTDCQIERHEFEEDDLRCDAWMIGTLAARVLPLPLAGYRSISLTLAMDVAPSEFVISAVANVDRVTLARASATIAPDGSIARCRTGVAQTLEGNALDLCHGPMQPSRDRLFDRRADGGMREMAISIEIAGVRR
ncbi:TonB family protein [Sphingomonas turrisvirgatae]|uniref:TonB C-terminal domain-containing protein n=1 Tax=Sphingomonas turrisvirgatae TaxID=1888892 RepID=A0A1E3M090_9SPHN|nr:TonB family protein [Sphingomonas turrisvirgatae]ODP39378.1 hypothetical protein BFL28_09825 [Sphingomonas turrisvirgatae]